MLEIFALIVLIVLLAAAVAVWVLLGMLPGKIARKRNHPQADAIAVCGWWGVITMGLLCPLAFIWAYTSCEPKQKLASPSHTTHDPQSAESQA